MMLAAPILAVIALANAPAAMANSARAISTGDYHSCAVTSAGGVKCWGWNYYGQLGNGTTTDSSKPVNVKGLSKGVVKVSVGSYGTCALTRKGAVKCWGYNNDGQLGIGTNTGPDDCNGNPCSTTPVAVKGLSKGVTSLSVGSYDVCAVTRAGAAKCWGSNGFGNLGDGTRTDRYKPTQVKGLSKGVASISATSYGHTCALTRAGSVKCWGWNVNGQLGDGNTTDSYTPVNVKGTSRNVIAVAVGGEHSCAVTNSGAVKCWGSDYYGELGDGSTHQRVKPVPVSGLSKGVVQISAGGYHTCAVTKAGAARCWGYNGYGQLGLGTKSGPDDCNGSPCSTTPGQVKGLSRGIWAISAGTNFEGDSQDHTCALTKSGTVKCWGYNFYGQVGDGTQHDRSKPVRVLGF
jgi:alpha-tubulin suppressor-like RCC1 family protein